MKFPDNPLALRLFPHPWPVETMGEKENKPLFSISGERSKLWGVEEKEVVTPPPLSRLFSRVAHAWFRVLPQMEI